MRDSGGPAMAPLNVAAAAAAATATAERGEERWRHFDNSVNAVSFGFVATAILISMFLVMAIFERFLRPRSPLLSSDGGDDAAAGGRHRRSGFRLRSGSATDLEAQRRGFAASKLDYPSPKMSVYSKGVSVLMPGHDIPTFIAHPAPAPCPPEQIQWPSHQQFSVGDLEPNAT